MPTGLVNNLMITLSETTFAVKEIEYSGPAVAVQTLPSTIKEVELGKRSVKTDVGEYLITEKYNVDLDAIALIHQEFRPTTIKTVKNAVKYFDMDVIIANSYVVAYKNDNLPEEVVAPASEFEYDEDSPYYRVKKGSSYLYAPIELSDVREQDLAVVCSDMTLDEDYEKLPAEIVKQLSKMKSVIKRHILPNGEEVLLTRNSRIVDKSLERFVGIPGSFLSRIIGVTDSGKFMLKNGAILKIDKEIYDD